MQRRWQAFVQDLVDRGLQGVRAVISDAHSGLRGAIRAVLNGTTWQRCYVHFIRVWTSSVRWMLRSCRSSASLAGTGPFPARSR